MCQDNCHACGSRTTATSDSKPFTVYCPNCGVLGVVTDSLVDPYNDSNLPTDVGPEWFRAAICNRLPGADIRTDQCTTVRVYWQDVVAGIVPLSTDGYRVSAGDALDQSDNITFEMSLSSPCASHWDAVHLLIEYCLAVVSRR